MFRLWRRHTPECPHREKGREYLNCRCPIWADGLVDGKRFRESLKTRDLRRAAKRIAEIENEDRRPPKEIGEAVESFLAASANLAPATLRKYRRVIHALEEFATEQKARHVDDLSVELLDGFQNGRTVGPLTWSKELPIIRQFLTHCLDRGWARENTARRLKLPRNAKPRAVEPYTKEELAKIISAAPQIGRGSYERLRARAMTLLFRYTALRISDVSVLQRAHVKNGEVFVRAEKNGKPVRLPLPRDLQKALDEVPCPRAASENCPYFFWSGHGSKESAVRDVRRTMVAVFRKAGVTKAHPHKFRHTLAVEILSGGGTIEDVASILGDSPATIRKHYAPWTSSRQDRISSLMLALHSGTFLAQSKNETGNR